MTYFLDLFSGIGGFALGAYWAGLRFDGHYFSEVDDYAIKVYQQRFPDASARRVPWRPVVACVIGRAALS